MKALTLALSVALTGCSTQEAILATYEPPESCAEIDAEMVELAENDAKIYTARGLKEGAAAGIGIAAAAGVLPVGFAWVPLAAAVAGQIRLPTHGERLVYLAISREQRECYLNDE